MELIEPGYIATCISLPDMLRFEGITIKTPLKSIK